MSENTVINPADYFDWNKAAWAQKTVSVRAIRVQEGHVTQPVKMKDGYLETDESQIAPKDGAYEVTAQSGETWQVLPEKFEARYDVKNPIGKNVYASIFAPKKIIKTENAVIIPHPWDSGTMSAKAGAIIVSEDDGTFYCIQPQEFADTHKVITNPGASKPTKMPKKEFDLPAQGEKLGTISRSTGFIRTPNRR